MDRLPANRRNRLRRWAICLALLGATAPFYAEIIDYLGGRSGSALSFYAFPIFALPVMFMLVSTGTLLIFSVLAINRRDWVVIIAVMLGLTAMWSYRVRLVQPDAFLVGFRYYLQRTASFEEMRNAGLRLRALQNKAEKSELDDWRDQNLWLASNAPPELLRVTENAYVSSGADCLTIEWGSALTRHWGVRIYYERAPTKEPNDDVFWISDDRVAFFKGIY